MNPAAAWAGTWWTEEVSGTSQHDPTKFVWRNFVSTLRDVYTPINIAGDAQARLRTHQSREFGRLHRTHDFDVLYKALKERGKALEERNGGKIPAAPTTQSRPTIPILVTHYIPTSSLPPSYRTSYYCYPCDCGRSTRLHWSHVWRSRDMELAKGN